MVLTKKKVIGLTLAGVLALSGTSVFAASEASSKDVQTPTLSATKAGKPGNGVKGELKARGEIPESVRKGLNGQKTGTANADKAGKDQVTLEEVEGVNVEDIKANAQEGKILKTSEIPDAAKKQSSGKTTGVKK
ncbi:hypothetical protein ACFOQM_13110 [Paenibacillus sp. GCM10012307]|uniref:Uncharacterized protein n=1 Tax=Paenibacillus roseus TaxID=2798579 RepID=A0A934J2S8_9BACL|nr:hypothetical protein [Paenibacillus roseus]MBJ6362234.1 hypothetical protein [Paenibacillus roseus]